MMREPTRRRLLWSGPVVGLLTAHLLVACSGAAAPSPSAAVPTGSPSVAPIPPRASASATPTASAPTPSPLADRTFVAPDGSFRMRLIGAHWTQDDGADPTALYLRSRIGLRPLDNPTLVSIRVGDAQGSITTCDPPARPNAPYALPEECHRAVATSIEELAGALGYSFVDFAELYLDGETAMSRDFHGYQYPAQGGQYLKYVLAMHDGRPVIVRFWTGREGGLQGVTEVLAGLRFLD